MSSKSNKFLDWIENVSFENCLLKREDYGAFIYNYIANEHDGFVLNLNGSWGTGKTEFLKRFYNLTYHRKHPVIYINAWESDFSKSPLTVVASELLTQLNTYNEDIGSEIDTLKENLGKVLKGAIVGTAGFISKQALDDASIGMETVKQLLPIETDPKDFVDRLKDNYNEQVNSIEQIRIQLSQLAETLKNVRGKQLPIIVLVDELDRCRPNYAIELLEVIKHFFTTENFVFIVASDSNQLCLSIKTIYGQDFDSETYLKRFFNVQAKLPSPDIFQYVHSKQLNLSKVISNKTLKHFHQEPKTDFFHNIIAGIIALFNPTLRDVDQILSKYTSGLRHISQKIAEKDIAIDIFVMLIAICEHHLGHPSFHSRECENHICPTTNNQYSLGNAPVLCYAEAALRCSTIHTRTHRSYGQASVYKSHATHQTFEELAQKSNDRDYLDFLRGYRIGTNKVENKEFSIWTWNQYKAMAELASNLT